MVNTDMLPKSQIDVFMFILEGFGNGLLLVIGGSQTHNYHSLFKTETEVISLSGSVDAKDLVACRNFPSRTDMPFFGVFRPETGEVVVCTLRKCFPSSQRNSTIADWTKFPGTSAQVGPVGTMIDKDNFWLTGGTSVGSDGKLHVSKQTKLINLKSGQVKKGEMLPTQLQNHCFARVNESVLLLIGGGTTGNGIQVLLTTYCKYIFSQPRQL